VLQLLQAACVLMICSVHMRNSHCLTTMGVLWSMFHHVHTLICVWMKQLLLAQLHVQSVLASGQRPKDSCTQAAHY
jgi:hypothetical protein